jgi:phosphomevalonate kinase
MIQGTQMYCRFAPQPLSNCMDLDSEHPNYPNVLYTTVINTKHRQWNQKIIPLSLPPGLDIVMGDVSGGSSSTSMVPLQSVRFVSPLKL